MVEFFKWIFSDLFYEPKCNLNDIQVSYIKLTVKNTLDFLMSDPSINDGEKVKNLRDDLSYILELLNELKN